MSPSPDDLRRIFAQTRTIAVFWANPRREAPAYYVPAYLRSVGYRVFPVHAARVHAGVRLFGEPMRRRLDEIPVPIDLINVYQVPQALPHHAAQILALQPRPRVVWFQQGIRHDGVAAQLSAVGIEVVQDHCAMVVHQLYVRSGDAA